MMLKVFESLRMRSKDCKGIDSNVFSSYCPINGFWSTRIYNVLSSGEDNINFGQFCIGNKCFIRSKDEELDEYIFQIFDLCNAQ